MVREEIIKDHLKRTINQTHFNFPGERRTGKVRDSYISDGKRILVTTDRLSCFDIVVTTIPFKGQVLNQLALYWFDQTKDIVPNHVLSSPDPNIIIGKECKVVPIEVVVRGYLTGSAWRDYESGKAISGIKLPNGLRKSAKFDIPVLTPSTKAAHGEHDTPISESEIIEQKIVSSALWEEIRSKALTLFKRGQKISEANGLFLVDTKYEFGIYNEEVILVDEIHTLDSSRYWVASEYEDRFDSGRDQKMLDKEPTRQWLISQGFMGEGAVPHFTDEHRIEIAKHYISSFELITGQEFKPVLGDPVARIEKVISSL